MASSQDEVERSDLQLKHLEFVRILTVHAVVLVSNLYHSAKESSASLKSTVDTVENAVKAVVGPVYERVKGVPTDLLVFLDNKVDEGALKFNEHAPPVAKTLVYKAQSLAQKASKVLKDLAEEAKVAGPLAALCHASEISKHVAIAQLAVVWYKANQHPGLHGMAEMAVPTAAYWLEKYNNLVNDMAGKGITLFNYVPLVPIEEMAKAYKQVEAGDEDKKVETASTSDSGSDKE